MKKFVIILMLLVVIIGCKKSETNLFKQSLYGTWELRKVAGGRAGITTTFPSGNGNIMTFTSNGQYSSVDVVNNSTVDKNGTYRHGAITSNGQKTDYLYFDNSNNPSYEVSIKNDTLKLYQVDISDGFASFWVKR